MIPGRGRGEVFVVSAPSGGGKTTLCRRVCESVDWLVYSVSHTTRARRPGEREGRDYFFVSDPVFDAMVEGDDFLEWARVYRYRYGTSREWLEAQLAKGLDVIMDVDTQGAERLRHTHLRTHQIFILPPSWDVLEHRLRQRDTDSPEEMEMRLQWARKELEAWKRFDFIVLNQDLNAAAGDLASIILAQRCRAERVRAWIERRSRKWIPSGG